MEPFNAEKLKQSSKDGEKSAAKALSVLAKKQVSVQTKDVQVVNAVHAKDTLETYGDQSVIAYTKTMSGFPGVSVLALERKSALDLVDAFNNRPRGTTVVLQELDRSTIRETLNILANAYVTEVSKVVGANILLSVPRMITKSKLEELPEISGIGDNSQALMFQTQMNVEDVGFEANLFFFFLVKVDNN